MPKPIPGKQYTIVDENSLSQVSLRAYGTYTHWPVIWRANRTALKSNNPDLIYPGEIIFIPEIAALAVGEPDISNREPDEITVIVDGMEIRYSNVRLKFTMDTLADGCNLTLPWVRGENPALDARLKPRTFPPVKVYMGGELKLTGYLYTPTARYSREDGSTKDLAIFSKTADMADSNMRPPFEENNVTLKQRATKLAAAHGLKAVFQADTGGKFDRVTAGESETVGGHLKKLATERGILQSSTAYGNLLYWEANVDAAPVCTLEEGKYPMGDIEFVPDGRRMFNSYRVVSTTPFGAIESPPVKDNRVPRSRMKNIRVQDSTEGELKGIARWARNQALADALTATIPVEGILNPASGKPWEVNTKVTVISSVMEVPDGFDFLIRSVEFDVRENEKNAILNVIPPQIYTKEDIIEPWG
jgi:prophage tail gpP-like protein